jgi:5-methylcytosine-specific restriction endonuclease McrBC regulatory subunit McrC
MNRLFEQFVQRAFDNASHRSEYRVVAQETYSLSIRSHLPKIRPDVTVWSGERVVAIADAKYKRDLAAPQNADVYQVITYGTVLDCPNVYLLYPQTEIDAERDFPVLNSPIVVKTRQVNVASRNAVECTEALAKSILLSSIPEVVAGAL